MARDFEFSTNDASPYDARNAIADIYLLRQTTRRGRCVDRAIRSFRSIPLTHLIGNSCRKLSNPRVCGKRRKRLLQRGFSRSRADKQHPETLGRRGRRSVTGETRDHPLLRSRASRSPLLSLSPPSTLSLTSLDYLSPHPSLHVCSYLFLSFVPSATPLASIYRLFFPIIFFVPIYLTPCVMYLRSSFIP